MADLENPFICVARGSGAAAPENQHHFHRLPCRGDFRKSRRWAGCWTARSARSIGTHTHVQTADEQIFPGGTAFLSDAGFTGPHESVIGREIEPVIKRFLTLQPQRFAVATGGIKLQGQLWRSMRIRGERRRFRGCLRFWGEGEVGCEYAALDKMRSEE